MKPFTIYSAFITLISYTLYALVALRHTLFCYRQKSSKDATPHHRTPSYTEAQLKGGLLIFWGQIFMTLLQNLACIMSFLGGKFKLCVHSTVR